MAGRHLDSHGRVTYSGTLREAPAKTIRTHDDIKEISGIVQSKTDALLKTARDLREHICALEKALVG